MSTKILFLGATGYLGGTILDGLLSHPKASQFVLTAYIRSADKAKKVEALGLGIKTVSGGLDVVEEAASKADFIFNCASSDDTTLNEAILRGAKKAFDVTKVPVKIIHTSGSAIVVDMTADPSHPSPAIDDADTTTLSALPITAIHRAVDIPLASASQEGYIRAYVVAPPFIYGLATGRFVDAGLQNPVPTAVMVLARMACERGVFGRVGEAGNVWSAVEAHLVPRTSFIVAKLELHIFTSVLEGKPLASGQAYYTGVDGEVVVRDVFAQIAAALHETGKLASAEITQLTPEEIAKWPILVFFGANSRMTDSRSRGLGWKPTHTSPKDCIASIKESIRVFASQG
ncbi:hypothetical protein EIP91_003287 [Steccherinum ochraceum]|uniref:Uncharacterized protein n=1 Tax=Steccherinum ochraceum TaxID=92696 RepID=A0A4R0RJ96_9APHY|nr:hypothetical protein EIP91_003287 [Steccherinum ochraceum]